jgi:hypothetical protein
MRWTKPQLFDLTILKRLVAQGACSTGGLFDPACNVGAVADSCTSGSDVGGSGGGECSGGSAPS